MSGLGLFVMLAVLGLGYLGIRALIMWSDNYEGRKWIENLERERRKERQQ